MYRSRDAWSINNTPDTQRAEQMRRRDKRSRRPPKGQSRCSTGTSSAAGLLHDPYFPQAAAELDFKQQEMAVVDGSNCPPTRPSRPPEGDGGDSPISGQHHPHSYLSPRRRRQQGPPGAARVVPAAADGLSPRSWWRGRGPVPLDTVLPGR
jgi:hypothetical protein